MDAETGRREAMFELDKELHSWCQAILRHSPKRTTRMVELEDHMHCEIEQLLSAGLSEEESFLLATKRFGDVEELAREYSKNQTPLSAICHRVEIIEGPVMRWINSQSLQRVAGLQILVALVFAGFILLSSYLFSGTGHEDMIRNLLIAVWFVPFILLSRGGSKRPSCKRMKLG
jgi:hypothetical protein